MKPTMALFVIIIALFAYAPASHAQPSLAPDILVNLVNQDPGPATAGDTVDVRIGVQNNGDLATNSLVMEFVPSYPFQLVSGEDAVQKLGTIQGSSGTNSANLKVVKYLVRVDKDAAAGDYLFKVKYYEEGSTATTEETVTVTVQGSESAEVIHINQTVLVPGKEDGLQFIINNVGTAPLRDLTFSWENTDKAILPVGSDNTRYIKYIDVGKSAELDYKVIADSNADPGLYLLGLHLSYTDPSRNGTKTISTQAGVYVGGGTDFDVAFSQNANGQMSFTVANIGSNPAYSVAVSIPNQRAWQVTGSNTNIVGNLNKGDYTTASFALQSSLSNRTATAGASGATGTSGQRQAGQGQFPQGSPSDQNQTVQFRQMNFSSSSILVHIAYTDTRGIRQTVDKEVTVGSGSASAGAGFASRQAATQQSVFVKYKWYFIGFVVLLVGFIVYRRISKKRLVEQEARVAGKKR
jgi:hypothetical protein